MPQKDKNSASPAEANNAPKSILGKEKSRYESKGFGLFFAILQVVAFYYYYPILMKVFWARMLLLMEEYQMSHSLFYLLFGFINSIIFVIMIQGFYTLCYQLELPIIERYKCLEEPWPWNEDLEAWNKLFWRSSVLYSFNVLCLNPFAYALHYLFDIPLELDFTMEGLPDSGKMCGQILFCMFVEDLTFHFSHRLLHTRTLYKYIHKIHHEHKVTISIAGQYAHPLEYIFGNLLPAAMGVMILSYRIHFVTAFTWYTLRYIESSEGHSGYEFSWSVFRVLPFGSDFGYHAYHHSHNIGNYSSFFTIWDSVFGSNKAYYEYLHERKETDSEDKKALGKTKQA